MKAKTKGKIDGKELAGNDQRLLRQVKKEYQL
jgi:hypothetical protein